MSPAKHVILFVIDGLRPDALRQANTSHIDELTQQGAYTWDAQTVTPSITLPCHVSMFCGTPPARHGVVTNTWVPPDPPVPSVIDVVHEAGLGTAAFYNWEQLRDLASSGALDVAYYRRLDNPPTDCDLEIAAQAAAYIAERNPAFTFVYLGATDEVGHRHGWMSAPYLRAISEADRAVGLVLEPLHASGRLTDTVCVVLSDHGGCNHGHSAGVPEDLTIPWIISGSGVRRGHRIDCPVSVMDAAPTIAYLLGLPLPTEWTGQVVTEALAL